MIKHPEALEGATARLAFADAPPAGERRPRRSHGEYWAAALPTAREHALTCTVAMSATCFDTEGGARPPTATPGAAVFILKGNGWFLRVLGCGLAACHLTDKIHITIFSKQIELFNSIEMKGFFGLGTWYSSPAFWVALGSAIVLLSAGAATLLTWIQWHPKMRLSVTASSYLLSQDPNTVLEYPRGRGELSEPHITIVRIANVGRGDISAVDFADGSPIRLDVGALIAQITSSTSSFSKSVRATSDGRILNIDPTLIRRGELFQIQLLTEGRAHLTLTSSLIDTDVRVKDESPEVLDLERGRIDEKPDISADDRLAQRAQMVADSLASATEIIKEIEAEVKARKSLIESLTKQAMQAALLTEEAVQRAALTEKQVAAVDDYLNRAMQARIGGLERFIDTTEKKTRRRDWLIATLVTSTVGLVAGVASILVAHFWLGF